MSGGGRFTTSTRSADDVAGWWTTSQVAQHLGCSAFTVQKLLNDHVIPHAVVHQGQLAYRYVHPDDVPSPEWWKQRKVDKATQARQAAAAGRAARREAAQKLHDVIVAEYAHFRACGISHEVTVGRLADVYGRTAARVDQIIGDSEGVAA